MKETENYAFPYPECDPPLVKDSSQIVQFGELALDVDEQTERIIDLMNENLAHPPAGRMAIAVLPVATTDSLVTPLFDVTVFTVGSMGASVAPGGLIPGAPGWYLAGCHALVSSATAAVLPMVRLIVNGTPVSSWGFPAGNYGVGNSRLAALSAVPVLMQAGDVLQMQIKHTAAGSPAWDYRPHLWAVRLIEA